MQRTAWTILGGAVVVADLVVQPPLITFEGDREDGRGYILEPDVDAIRAEVRDLIGAWRRRVRIPRWTPARLRRPPQAPR
jgi:hypothetical protein